MRAGRQLLEAVAIALGEHSNRVVFVGGTTLSFYVDTVAEPEIRTTNDVDCVVEVLSHVDRLRFEKQLERRGFRHDTSPRAPPCRWFLGDIPVDIMSPVEKDQGFTNSWYASGVRSARHQSLTSGQAVRIFSPAFFLASKFEAMLQRGASDLRLSRDLDDIVFVITNNSRLQRDLLEDDPVPVQFVAKELNTLLQSKGVDEAIRAQLQPGLPADAMNAIMARLRAIADIRP